MKTIGDQQLLKRMNRSVLLRLLRAQPGLSRARLAIESGLTKSTVSLLVRELLDEGWLKESDAAVNDGLGRPSTPLQINVGVRALMGVEIAVETVRLVCVSLQGEVLYSNTHALTDGSPAGVCAQVARMASAAHKQLDALGLSLSSIGVCVPGAVDDCTGVVRFAPNLGWRNVSLLPALEKSLAAAGLPGVTVQLQNDADAAVLGEYEFAAGEGEDPLIFVSCDVGVGAGVMLNDRLFTGAQGMAGEIGHTILELDGPAVLVRPARLRRSLLRFAHAGARGRGHAARRGLLRRAAAEPVGDFQSARHRVGRQVVRDASRLRAGRVRGGEAPCRWRGHAGSRAAHRAL
jgi:predicted NBD/HSP70 family sugar kinase